MWAQFWDGAWWVIFGAIVGFAGQVFYYRWRGTRFAHRREAELPTIDFEPVTVLGPLYAHRYWDLATAWKLRMFVNGHRPGAPLESVSVIGMTYRWRAGWVDTPYCGFCGGAGDAFFMCQCGLYALHLGYSSRRMSATPVGFHGVVELRGRVIEHTLGYRATELRIVALRAGWGVLGRNRRDARRWCRSHDIVWIRPYRRVRHYGQRAAERP